MLGCTVFEAHFNLYLYPTLQAAFASTSLPYVPYVVALDAEAEFTSRTPPWAAFEWWAREP